MRVAFAAGLVLLLSAAAAASPLHDTDLVLHGRWVRGAEATAWLRVTGATTLDDAAPVAGATVTLAVVPAGTGKPIPVAEATTAADGVARVRFRVPTTLAAGSARLIATTRSRLGADTLERSIEITQPTVLHLRTDRPVYRAGQILRWRTTMLGGADAHPRTGEPVDVEVRDPRGTAIWRGRVTTDAAGMGIGEVPLGDDLTFGTYTLSARAAEAQSTERVEVRDFVLPPYEASITVDAKLPVEPGAKVTGHVVARHTYGAPVAGRVALKGLGGGDLDKGGTFAFTARAPRDGTPLTLSAEITDGAGRRREATLEVPVRADALELAVVPDRALVAGARASVTVITTDGAGEFVPTRVWVRFAGRPRIEKITDGAARVPVDLAADEGQLAVEVGAVAADGRVARRELTWDVEQRGRSVAVQDGVVAEGQPIALDGAWPDATGPLVAVLLRKGAPVAQAPVVRTASGTITATLVAPTGVFGLATVRVVGAGWDRATGADDTGVASASVYLVPARLAITVDAATRHAPGSDAKIGVTVRDARGKPVAGVGVAASVVDERVLALGERRPDLTEVLARLDVATAEEAGLTFASLLARPEPRARLALGALLAALPPDRAPPAVRVAAAERFRAELRRIERARTLVEPLLEIEPTLGVRDARGAWSFRPALDGLLERAGATPAERITPWRQATAWTYAHRLDPAWTFDALAPGIAERRLAALEERLSRGGRELRVLAAARPGDVLATLLARRRVEPWMIVDPWVTTVRVEPLADRIDVVSAGPDQRFGTADDLRREDVFHQLGGYGLVGYGEGGGGYGSGEGGVLGGRVASSPNVAFGAPISPLEAAVRERFDETVLWTAGLRTDAQGSATLTVPLADSITGWQVAIEAVSGGGAVGTALAHLETYLAVHVDADPPARLTTGDTIDIPVVVSNHGTSARTFSITPDVRGALTANTGPIKVTVPAGEVRAAHVPVRAIAAGTGSLELALTDGGRRVDAVRRTIPVDPPGALVRTAESAPADRPLAFQVPATVAPGSVNGRVRLFRGALDQAQDGLEDLLQEPHGCFEQTSSTTYPNLLVLDVLGTRTGADALRARARELVGKGYQRLISYEVEGGGFSWFGDAPANQVLTAYGLLEFVDMARVYPVDDELIARTRAWLVSKQHADGSWSPDASFLHDWSAVQGKVSTTAYLAWALAEAGQRGKPLERALTYLRNNATTLDRSPYLLSLWAAAEAAAAARPAVPLARLARHARTKGDTLGWTAGGQTLFYASGTAADVQVTSLAAMALGQTGDADRAKRALAWIWDAREGGGWGETQGTVLALRAAARAVRPAPLTGTARVRVDGKLAGTVDLAAIAVPTVELPANLDVGPHTITIEGVPAGALTAELRVSYREATIPVAQSAGLTVALTTDDEPIKIGARTQLAVTVTNPGKQIVAMPMVVIPVPPGFRADPMTLRGLKTQVSRVEESGTEVRLYLDHLDPSQRKTFTLQWEATTRAQVLQRPAVAYAYYDPKTRASSAALSLSAD